ADVVGEALKIITYPEVGWQQVLTDYLNRYGKDVHDAVEKEQEETTYAFIEEERKIAVDGLLEIKERIIKNKEEFSYERRYGRYDEANTKNAKRHGENTK